MKLSWKSFGNGKFIDLPHTQEGSGIGIDSTVILLGQTIDGYRGKQVSMCFEAPTAYETWGEPQAPHDLL